MNIDLASLILGIVAFLCSIVSLVINYNQNKKISSLNIQSRYYEKIFDEYLIKKIPKSRNYMKYINDKLIDADKLIDTLGEMKNDALFFKYNEEKFYKELTKVIDDLEELLTEFSNKPESDQDKQYGNINTIKEKVTEIYRVIHTYSNGEEK